VQRDGSTVVDEHFLTGHLTAHKKQRTDRSESFLC
jgi:hypothetical protein